MPQERDYRITACFADVPLGVHFWNNGNVWRKKSSRTAAGVWPAILPETAYFGQKEKCRY